MDLAFRLRELGLSVRLDASVRVVHAQGASAPSTAAAQTLRDANQARFRDRWRARLWHRPTLLGAQQAHRFVAARDCEAVDRILVIAGADRAERAAARQLGRALAGALASGQVTVVFPDEHDETEVVTSPRADNVEVVAPDIWDGWLAGRRFHFAAVVAGPAEQVRSAAILADTQPQATTVAPPPRRTLDDPAALGAWLLELGLVPARDGAAVGSLLFAGASERSGVSASPPSDAANPPKRRVRSLARPLIDVLDRRFAQVNHRIDALSERIDTSGDTVELRRQLAETVDELRAQARASVDLARTLEHFAEAFAARAEAIAAELDRAAGTQTEHPPAP